MHGLRLIEALAPEVSRWNHANRASYFDTLAAEYVSRRWAKVIAIMDRDYFGLPILEKTGLPPRVEQERVNALALYQALAEFHQCCPEHALAATSTANCSAGWDIP